MTGAEAAGKAAVFPFELQQGDVVPGAPDKREAEQKRLAEVTQSLRELMVKSGFEVVDIAPVAEKAAAANLQSCGDCADEFARELGADYAVTGVVFKVSELVLSMNVRVHDAKDGKPLTSAVVDMRGNTDESWRRAISYLYRNVLSPRLETLTK
ncbi:DUF3280 domain-containing protein [Mesorhizobium sp. LHD-90]|uniref:DUF3280 domain-containing protein n=1 Tax=Mesorhizobium sp. LHD-90 TaxID=3071414 RepID=UPI0027DF29EA|nr:DUF3280 domain-containing protein [Mesorhizobium sp. LHD-90]MDQ6435411.1 DUF3280 domain-containing protein [Mesorhizobium sp. LHD-90]